MTIHEPATLATDVLLAALAGCCAWHLRRKRPEDNPAVRWWSRALGFTAASALVGGLYHGFAPNFPAAIPIWWRLTLLLLCLTSVAMGMTLVHEVAASGRIARWRMLVAWKFVVAALVALTWPKFIVAVADYGAALLAWAAAALLARRPWSGWMLAAIGLSVAAAVVQQMRWAPSPRFNHNDLYHVIQAVALLGFLRAGLRFRPPA